jgi:hypothetical protein
MISDGQKRSQRRDDFGSIKEWRMELQINLSHRLWTRKSAWVEECQTAVKRLRLTGASDYPF